MSTPVEGEIPATIMARLHKYVESSDKSGYHLRGRSPESNTTFQVGRAAEQLIDWLGIETGERIPDELLWQLYELRLIWTESSGRKASVDEDLLEYLRNSEGRKSLSDEDLTRLRQFIEDYDGTQSEKVQRLESLVADVEYRSPEKEVKRFSEENQLSDIAKRYYSRNEIDDNVIDVVTANGDSNPHMDSLRNLPAVMIDSIPEFNNSFFELIEIEISEMGVTYSFEDPEMWIGSGMVWTEWKLFDRRMKPDSYLEAEFEIDTDHWKVESPVEPYTVLRDGEPTYFEILSDTEGDDSEMWTGLEITESPFDEFQKYVYDCLYRQFKLVSEYQYTGPGPFFER